MTLRSLAQALIIGVFGLTGCQRQRSAVHFRPTGSNKFTDVTIVPSAPQPVERLPRIAGNKMLWHGVPVGLMVHYAFDVPLARLIIHQPPELYDIDASFNSSTTEDDIKEMIRSLLITHFALRSHRETRDTEFLNLGSSGAKSKLKTAVTFAPLDIRGEKIQTNEICDCRFADEGRVAGSGVTVQQIADVVSDIVSRPVVDGTGLTGRYVVDVPYAYGAKPATSPALPTIDIALQKTLGLRLEGDFGPVDMMIVDHVERLQ